MRINKNFHVLDSAVCVQPNSSNQHLNSPFDINTLLSKGVTETPTIDPF